MERYISEGLYSLNTAKEVKETFHELYAEKDIAIIY